MESRKVNSQRNSECICIRDNTIETNGDVYSYLPGPTTLDSMQLYYMFKVNTHFHVVDGDAV